MEILSELTRSRTLYAILDAMDECDQEIRDDLLWYLKGVSKDVQILVTARLLGRRDDLSKGLAMQTI